MAALAAIERWFFMLTGHDSPRPWQRQLMDDESCRDRLIRIPTGLGKTEGVLASWTYNRIARGNDEWPRRLVWCLPMRVLVEQTEEVAQALAMKVPEEHRPGVFVAMGGEDPGEWFLYPERPAIIIGTQDMLLSRALNRGYASPRARWPMEFALLNHDALWVMDEVQTMGVGLATSAQLQAFRGQDRPRSLRPCNTWWMSATLQPQWLKTVDTKDYFGDWTREPIAVRSTDQTGGLWESRKPLTIGSVAPKDARGFAQLILTGHHAAAPGDFGRITLVICNTVDRACDTYDALRGAGRVDGIELIHSRFRPAEREEWSERFLRRSACSAGVDRIIVATQVVEAGVDISASCLVSELAPWPSLVQRFGRCARYGGSGRVIVIDRGTDGSLSAPYSSRELESSLESLSVLDDVGIATLESHEQSLSPEGRAKLYPYEPAHLLLRREFDELFDTTPDLTGADLDISRYIRSGEERDLQVFWADLHPSDPPSPRRRPRRSELCAVPLAKAQQWLCGNKDKRTLRPGVRAWVWDWIDGTWIDADRTKLLPGRTVCVASACGGYRRDLGFAPSSKALVPVVPLPPVPSSTCALYQADDQQDGENLSFAEWKTIATHGTEVAAAARAIADALQLPGLLRDALHLAGLWHDWGKAHPAFQGAIRSHDRPSRQDLAKGPDSAWLRPRGTYRFPDDSDQRPSFRHELASALALFSLLEIYSPDHPALLGAWGQTLVQMGHSPGKGALAIPPSDEIRLILDCSAETFNLVVYLVASHHGKVRAGWQASPKDQDYRDRDGRGLPIRGVREGDQLPAIHVGQRRWLAPAVSLTLEPAAMGLSGRTGPSWQERCSALVDEFSPAGLAFLESLLRAADVRASRLRTNDPLLEDEEGKT